MKPIRIAIAFLGYVGVITALGQLLLLSPIWLWIPVWFGLLLFVGAYCGPRLIEWSIHGHWRTPRSRRDSDPSAYSQLTSLTSTRTARRTSTGIASTGLSGISIAYGTPAVAEGSNPGVTFPVRQDDVPILAVKQAIVTHERNGDYTFRSLNAATPYGIDAQATCLAGHPHAAPELECSCGFYARVDGEYMPFGQVWQVTRRSGRKTSANCCAVLDVQLSGRVVVHSRGYRAEHQQVLSVRFTPNCGECGSVTQQLLELDDCYISSGGFQDPSAHFGILTVLCNDCATRSMQDVSLDDISANLGIPITWGEPVDVHRYLGS